VYFLGQFFKHLSLGSLLASEGNRLFSAPSGGRRDELQGLIANRNVLTKVLVVQEDFFPNFLFYPKEFWEIRQTENLQLTTTRFI
jgi:hypothetical protein